MTRMVRTNFLRLLTLLLAESGSSRAPLHISPHRGGPSPDSLAESPRVPGRAVAGKLLYETAVSTVSSTESKAWTTLAGPHPRGNLERMLRFV